MSEASSHPDKIAILTSVAPLIARYDAVLCDVWGVVHNGVEAIASACAALGEMRRAGCTVLLLSNAPRPWRSVREQIDGWGVPRDSYDGIVTSGDGTRHLLRQQAARRLFHLGPERDRPLFAGLAVDLVPLEQAELALCTGLYDDNVETPEDYADILSALKRRDVPMICANPDILVERGARLVYCAGAVAKAYEALGGRVRYAGKPFAPIYDLALEKIAEKRGRSVPKSRVLAIGDGLKTDMEGAFRTGLDALFVASGLHVEGMDEDRALTHETLARLFAESAGRPIAAQRRLCW